MSGNAARVVVQFAIEIDSRSRQNSAYRFGHTNIRKGCRKAAFLYRIGVCRKIGDLGWVRRIGADRSFKNIYLNVFKSETACFCFGFEEKINDPVGVFINESARIGSDGVTVDHGAVGGGYIKL